ncbi:hypothetical protein ABW19_dt0200990 [Dactylella cylindrospora]|nr:hypothetical protein ABW19_dt0200990 [Dactylella cylindrospora]
MHSYQLILLGAAAIQSVAGIAIEYEEWHVKLLRRQAPGTPAYNCHDNCGQAITASRRDDKCDNPAFYENYGRCLQCSGPDNENIWRYYGFTLGAAGAECGLSTTPLEGEQDDVGPAIPAGGTIPSGVTTTTTAAPTSATTTTTTAAPPPTTTTTATTTTSEPEPTEPEPTEPEPTEPEPTEPEPTEPEPTEPEPTTTPSTTEAPTTEPTEGTTAPTGESTTSVYEPPTYEPEPTYGSSTTYEPTHPTYEPPSTYEPSYEPSYSHTTIKTTVAPTYETEAPAPTGNATTVAPPPPEYTGAANTLMTSGLAIFAAAAIAAIAAL